MSRKMTSNEKKTLVNALSVVATVTILVTIAVIIFA